MSCPSFENLIAFLDDNLAPPEAERIAGHLVEGCPSCAADREWYLQVRSIAANDTSVEPPAWVTRRALQIFDHKRPLAQLRGAVAALIFDSFVVPQVAGVRSTDTLSRQLLYQAGNFSIDLQITPAGQSQAEIAGQILCESESAFESVAHSTVTLSRTGQEWIEATANEMGEFSLNAIPQGNYDLLIETRAGSIEILGIPVESKK